VVRFGVQEVRSSDLGGPTDLFKPFHRLYAINGLYANCGGNPDLLGTSTADKRHIILEASHDVTPLRQVLMRATLDWLDKYLGPVRR
jgi:hypothetical protein